MLDTLNRIQHQGFFKLGMDSIRSLEDENGILASSREEMFGCVFGRDSAITGLKLLRVYERTQDRYLTGLVRKILTSLSRLQGTSFNIESGEEPGKCIHEYRPTGHEHLTDPSRQINGSKPWYVYDDGVMRIYDTVDATPLMLILFWRYLTASGDAGFMNVQENSIRQALYWLLTYADSNNDGLIDYRIHPDRRHGGLVTQSWMDSAESVFLEEGDEKPSYPIAPLEVQGYAYMALRVWANVYGQSDPKFSLVLDERADLLKREFQRFISYNDYGDLCLAPAIDGKGRVLGGARSSMGHLLWASVPGERPDCILDRKYLRAMVRRMMKPDLFDANSGIRTLSSTSKFFDASSYHNGSVWAHDTAIVAEGLDNFGYGDHAEKLYGALLWAYQHFQTPIEMFVSDENGLHEYSHGNGAKACRVQAWSAASMLDVASRTNVMALLH